MGHRLYLVEDDTDVREALALLLRTAGMDVETFPNATVFLGKLATLQPGCIIADIRMPAISGLQLQERLREQSCNWPIIIITGHGDIPSSVRAIKHGALDFLTKPFSDTDVMAAVNAAITQDRDSRADRARLSDLRRRYASLTPREREVLPLVVSGFLNKQSAAKLGISEVTLQVHRRNVMLKMAVTSVTDLVRIAERLGIEAIGQRARGDRL